MRGNNKVKWLKIAGWVLIPYIMILFTFKRLHGAKRIAGIAWAVVALVIAIASQSTPPTEKIATTGTTPATSATEKKTATTVTETKAAAEETAEEPAPEEPAVEKPVAEPAEEPAITEDWQAEIKKIASSDGSTNEKSDAAIKLARSYMPSAEEKKEFEEYIVSEYKSGKYLSGLDDEKYALTNIFKSSVVERQYEDSEQAPIQSFAFDFYQNTKDVFRGIRDSVESNEEQMDKALAKME